MTYSSDHGDVRDQLFDAAKDLIASIGFTEMSHADLTADVGIGRTTFYEYFASKEDLLVQLVRRDLPPLVDEIVGKLDADSSPAERLHHLTRAMVEFVGTDHIGLILHTELPHLSPEAQQQISEAHTGMSLAFASIYRDGVRQGVFRTIPRSLVGPMMEQMIMTGGRAVMDSKNPKKVVGEIARHTADMLVSSFSVGQE